MNDRQRLEAIIEVLGRYLPPDGPLTEHEAINEIIGLVDPLPPVAPKFEAPEVTDEMCERVSRAFDAMPIRAIHREYGRDMIVAVRTELGPTLGLVTREEMARAIKATDDAASDCDYMLDSDDCIRVIRGELGPDDFKVRKQLEAK